MGGKIHFGSTSERLKEIFSTLNPNVVKTIKVEWKGQATPNLMLPCVVYFKTGYRTYRYWFDDLDPDYYSEGYKIAKGLVEYLRELGFEVQEERKL